MSLGGKGAGNDGPLFMPPRERELSHSHLLKIPAGEAQRDFPVHVRTSQVSLPFKLTTSYPRLRSANSVKKP